MSISEPIPAAGGGALPRGPALSGGRGAKALRRRGSFRLCRRHGRENEQARIEAGGGRGDLGDGLELDVVGGARGHVDRGQGHAPGALAPVALTVGAGADRVGRLGSRRTAHVPPPAGYAAAAALSIPDRAPGG